MLNSTLTATERTLCCILENYQTPDGVRVPPVLQPFMMGIDFIPFRKVRGRGEGGAGARAEGAGRLLPAGVGARGVAAARQGGNSAPPLCSHGAGLLHAPCL